MKIAMFTNTYLPQVGGVAESVRRLAEDVRNAGHAVRVVAPQYSDAPQHESDVVRVPAVQNFNGSDFSMSLPVPFLLSQALEAFQPDILHAHHPYLLGDTALRLSASLNLPLVLTYHTNYEQYTHYVPLDSPRFKRFVIELTAGFANLCDQIIAPSDSIAAVLRERAVTTPIMVIPTGIDLDTFANGDGPRFRQRFEIPGEAYVVGHVGRLAPEKNLDFLSAALAQFLQQQQSAYVLVVGDGESRDAMTRGFQEAGVQERVRFSGVLQGQELVDAYHAMDVFAFASKTETQGMVLAEAMAAGNPVVALDAPGVREIVEDRQNGRLLPHEDAADFCAALTELTAQGSPTTLEEKRRVAQNTARDFSRTNTCTRVIELYSALQTHVRRARGLDDGTWDTLLREAQQEWDLWSNLVSAGIESFKETPVVSS